MRFFSFYVAHFLPTLSTWYMLRVVSVVINIPYCCEISWGRSSTKINLIEQGFIIKITWGFCCEVLQFGLAQQNGIRMQKLDHCKEYPTHKTLDNLLMMIGINPENRANNTTTYFRMKCLLSDISFTEKHLNLFVFFWKDWFIYEKNIS